MLFRRKHSAVIAALSMLALVLIAVPALAAETGLAGHWEGGALAL